MTERTADVATGAESNPGSNALTPAQLQQAAADGSLWTLTHTVIGIPIAFVANAIVARSLGAADYGHLAVITLMMAVAIAITNLGVGEAVQQWGAAAYARGDQAEVDRILRSSLGFHALIQMPMLAGTALVLGRGQPVWVNATLLLATVVPPLLGSSSLCISIENRTAQASRMSMVTNLIVQIAIASTAAATHSPVGVWAARAVVPALTQPANFLLLSPHRRRVALSFRIPREMPAGFWRFSLLTAAGGVLGILVVSRSEILVLQWLGSAQMVGVFALAFGIASQLRGPVEALLAPMLPGVAGIVEVHPELAAATLLRALRVSVLFTAGIVLGLPVLVALIPVVYGKDFAESSMLLPVLAVAALTQALINPLLAFARAQRLSGRILGSNLGSLAVDLLVALGLVHLLGVWGAVVGAVSAQAVSLVLMARIQVTQGVINWRTMARACAPLILAITAAVITVATWFGGAALPLALAVYLLTLGAWVAGMRAVSTESLADLHRVAAVLPGPLESAANNAIRLLEGKR